MSLNKGGLKQKNVYYKTDKGNSGYYENLLRDSLTNKSETQSSSSDIKRSVKRKEGLTDPYTIIISNKYLYYGTKGLVLRPPSKTSHKEIGPIPGNT